MLNSMKQLLKKVRKLPARFWRRFNELTYNQKGLIGIFIVLVFAALAVRYMLIPVTTPDFKDFLQPWMQHMHTKGLAGLGDDFSNYNTPYLLLLWIASYLPFSQLVSVKLVSIGFDFILATLVALVIRHYRPHSVAPYGGFLAVLFAPTVLQNGAMWAQCDVIYTSFIVAAFYAYLKKRFNLMWILWGVAFAFKLQAMFFAPFLLFAALYHRKSVVRGPLYAGLTVFFLSIPPLFFGKTLGDVVGIYLGQSKPIRTDWGLAWFAPTAYQWVSNVYFDYLRKAGVVFGGVIALGSAALAFIRKFDEKSILLIATFILLAVPFFMPTIHERYMFAGEIFLIITAFVVPKLAWTAILMQIITTMAYQTYFTQANEPTPIPFAWLSLGVLIIIYTLGRGIYKPQQEHVLKH